MVASQSRRLLFGNSNWEPIVRLIELPGRSGFIKTQRREDARSQRTWRGCEEGVADKRTGNRSWFAMTWNRAINLKMQILNVAIHASMGPCALVALHQKTFAK